MFKNELIQFDQDQLIIKQKFEDLLKQTKINITKANYLLNQPIESLNDDEVTALVKDLNTVKKFDKEIENIKKEIRKYFDTIKKEYLDVFQNTLNQYDYEELNHVIGEIDNLKNNIKHLRKSNNWQTVKDYFNEQLKLIDPNYIKHAPKSFAFTTFQVLNESMVNANKTWKLKKQYKEQIAQYLNDQKQAIETIFTHDGEFIQRLLNHYENTQNLAQTIQLHQQLREEKEYQLRLNEQRIKEEAERRAQELLKQQEIERLAKEKVEMEQQKQLEKERLNASFENLNIDDTPFQTVDTSPIEQTKNAEQLNNAVITALASILHLDAADTSEIGVKK